MILKIKKIILFLFICPLFAFNNPNYIENCADKKWELLFSFYTKHYRQNIKNYYNHQYLTALEKNLSKHQLLGAMVFKNSYRQPCQAAFWGYKIYPLRFYPISLKFRFGLCHGYKGAYKHNVRLNHLGIFPFIVPSLWMPLPKSLTFDTAFFYNSGFISLLGYQF